MLELERDGMIGHGSRDLSLAGQDEERMGEPRGERRARMGGAAVLAEGVRRSRLRPGRYGHPEGSDGSGSRPCSAPSARTAGSVRATC